MFYINKKSTMNQTHSSFCMLLIASVSLLSLTGCTYYQITDPNTDAVYYTTQKTTYKHSGSTKFKDAVTGDEVTLTGHKVRKLKGDAWKAAVEEHKAQ